MSPPVIYCKSKKNLSLSTWSILCNILKTWMRSALNILVSNVYLNLTLLTSVHMSYSEVLVLIVQISVELITRRSSARERRPRWDVQKLRVWWWHRPCGVAATRPPAAVDRTRPAECRSWTLPILYDAFAITAPAVTSPLTSLYSGTREGNNHQLSICWPTTRAKVCFLLIFVYFARQTCTLTSQIRLS